MSAGLYAGDGAPFCVWVSADRSKLEAYVRRVFADRLAAPFSAIELSRCELGLLHVRCAGKRVGYVIISKRDP